MYGCGTKTGARNLTTMRCRIAVRVTLVLVATFPVLCVALSCSGYLKRLKEQRYYEALPSQSRAVIDGHQFYIRSLIRDDHSMLVVFVHETLDEADKGNVTLHEWLLLNCYYWDADGKVLGEPCPIEVWHDAAYMNHHTGNEMFSFRVEVPDKAHSLAIQYGKSQWKSKRVLIPPIRTSGYFWWEL
jgi:hypothetical protein